MLFWKSATERPGTVPSLIMTFMMRIFGFEGIIGGRIRRFERQRRIMGWIISSMVDAVMETVKLELAADTLCL